MRALYASAGMPKVRGAIADCLGRGCQELRVTRALLGFTTGWRPRKDVERLVVSHTVTVQSSLMRWLIHIVMTLKLNWTFNASFRYENENEMRTTLGPRCEFDAKWQVCSAATARSLGSLQK